MQNKNTLIIALLALVFCVPVSFSQSNIVTTGGDASDTDGSASYTFGQVQYLTHSSVDGSVAEGVQQPYEIYTVGIMEIANDPFELSVYPNPAIDYLTLKGKSTIDQELSYSLCDANGKVLKTLSITDDVTSIEMSSYTASTYFLNVTKGGTTIKSFKIIKKH